MPTYSVRTYHTYMDEYHVTATTKHEAVQLAQRYRDWKERPDTGDGTDWTGKVTQRATREYLEENDTCVNELDEHGMWIIT
jgi:hypothetical protein